MLRSNWTDLPIAIVGMACRLPGANDRDGFWKLIVDQRCALQPVPKSRCDADLYYDPRREQTGKSYSLPGGVVPDRPNDQALSPLTDEIVDGIDHDRIIAPLPAHVRRRRPASLIRQRGSGPSSRCGPQEIVSGCRLHRSLLE